MAVEAGQQGSEHKVDRSRRGDPHAVRQVIALVGGPVAVLLSQQAKYLLVFPACSSNSLAPLHAAALGGVALALGCAALGFVEWRRAGGRWPDHGPGTLGRSRFMGVLTMLMAGTSALVILAQWIPDFLVSPCQT
jgi:hypothetical protein